MFIQREHTEAEKAIMKNFVKEIHMKEQILNFNYSLVLCRSEYMTEKGKKIYRYLIAATTPQGKGNQPIDEITRVYTDEKIAVGEIIPVRYDFFNKKHKLNKKEWKEYKQRKEIVSLEDTEPQAEEPSDNEENLPF